MWLTNSSVGRKLIMSISGLFLILFLTFHMCMNLVAIVDGNAYNTVCGMLGSNWYAVAGTAVLAAGVIVHFAYAIMLTLQNRKARGEQSYAVSEKPASVEFASQNMFVLGAIVIIFIVIHLTQFWAHMMLPELMGSEENGIVTASAAGAPATQNGAALIKHYFQNPVIAILYLVWFVALWFHLTHGFWSAFQTIGWSNKKWLCRLQCIGKIYATVICLGFAATVIFGYLCQFCPCCQQQ